jgi:hypothetical protein
MREVPPMPEPDLYYDWTDSNFKKQTTPAYTTETVRSRDAIWAGMLEEAVREERERCAKLVEQEISAYLPRSQWESNPDDFDAVYNMGAIDTAQSIAAAIRGKSEDSTPTP